MKKRTISEKELKRPNLQKLIEASVLIALGTILSVFTIPMPFGGGITLFSMVPLLYLGYKHGIKWGLASGFVYSLLQLMLGWQNVIYSAAAGALGIAVCIFFDYIAAFTVLGLSGIFKKRSSSFWSIALGIIFVVLLRFLSHFFSGGLIWYELTKVWEAGNSDNMVFKYSTWIYSFVYNIIYMGPELLSSLILAPFILRLTSIRDK